MEPDGGDGPEGGLAAGFEGLDDDHPPAAARASIPVFVVATIFGVIARPARWSWVGYGEEPAGQCNVAGPGGIGGEAVVTDAMKSVGQDMDQETADELVGVAWQQVLDPTTSAAKTQILQHAGTGPTARTPTKITDPATHSSRQFRPRAAKSRTTSP